MCELETRVLKTFSLLSGKVLLPRRFILDNAYLKPNDASFVGGSLIEGVGNRFSDVDVHVITDELLCESDIRPESHYRVLSPERSILGRSSRDSKVFLIHTVVPHSHIKVDIEYRTRAEVDALVAQLRDTFDYAVESLILLTKYMSARDMAFIHRLFNSRLLTGSPELHQMKDRIGLFRFIYLMYRWKASDFSVLLDILGAWEDADLKRCADLARENMVAQFHAYCHLHGNTNYHRKWIIKYAELLRVDRPLLDRYLRLLLGACGHSDSELRHYITQTIDFVDDIFLASHRILSQVAAYPSGIDACSAIDEFFKAEAGDYSKMEIVYRKKPYGIMGTPTSAWFTV